MYPSSRFTDSSVSVGGRGAAGATVTVYPALNVARMVGRMTMAAGWGSHTEYRDDPADPTRPPLATEETDDDRPWVRGLAAVDAPPELAVMSLRLRGLPLRWRAHLPTVGECTFFVHNVPPEAGPFQLDWSILRPAGPAARLAVELTVAGPTVYRGTLAVPAAGVATTCGRVVWTGGAAPRFPVGAGDAGVADFQALHVTLSDTAEHPMEDDVYFPSLRLVFAAA